MRTTSGIKLNKDKVLQSFMEDFVDRMSTCVDLSSKGKNVVRELNIQDMYYKQLNKLDSLYVEYFKKRMREHTLSKILNEHGYVLQYQLENLSIDQLKTRIKDIALNIDKSIKFETWAKFYLSSKLYLPLLSKAVFIGVVSSAIFSLGIFGKSNNKDSSTTA